MTPNELRQVFQAPYSRQNWIHTLQFLSRYTDRLQFHLEPIKFPFNTDEADKLITTFYEIGILKTSESVALPIFEILLNDKVQIGHNKVTVNNFVKKYIVKDAIRGALVTFSYENSNRKEWRFSFISKNTASDFFVEVESLETHPKKYTYVFGTEESHATAIQRFFSLHQSNFEVKDFFNAFEVEALNKEFFEGYKNIYEDFVEYITGKRFVKEKGKWVEKEKQKPNSQYLSAFGEDDKSVRDYVKKLLGRLVFLYFLQKKGWLNNDVNYLKNLFEKSNKKTFLEDVLKPLFFGVLNTKPQERMSLFGTEGWNLSLLKEWEQIPYLNGGLFEKDTIDQNIISFSEDLFENTFQFFSEYNFTIDENDPEDTQVGIDPEMLGKIFENLLEDNKDKGAFYTPKEIVQYMCRESLITYLTEKHKDEEINIRTFVEQHFSPWEDTTSQAVLNSIKEVKICDPAIGSGAFPMGMLNELYKCRLALGEEKSVKIKKDIIQNNIYGVDIEKGAVDIARLRFWLALVVDESIPEPLPNLDFKIMQGNSLLESYQGVDLSKLVSPQTESYLDKKNGVIINIFGDTLNAHRIELSNCMNDYFSCADLERKIILRKEIDKKIRQQIKDTYFKIDLSDINLSANHHFFLWHTYFSDVFKGANNLDNSGFDIVIGNPPYGAKSSKENKKLFIKNYQSAKSIKGIQKGSLDTYTLFIELGYNLLKKNGNLSFIVPISITSSEAVTGVYRILENGCEEIRLSSYAVRPKPIFENAMVNTSIIQFIKTESPCKKIFSTKMYRRGKEFDLKQLLDNLEFIEVKEVRLKGRIPKISYDIEKNILQKILIQNPIGKYISKKGNPIYYRGAGGRYFKIITNYPTGSSAEKEILLPSNLSNSIGCILSSNLSFWFYQIYSDNLNWKSYELENFTIPNLSDENIISLEKLYKEYLLDIESNVNYRNVTNGSSYNISEFKEYKIQKSKHIIDQIDDLICPLYGLTQEETNFIKNYEIEFRLSDSE